MKQYIKPETLVNIVTTAAAFLKASNVVEVSTEDYNPDEMTPLSRKYNVWDDGEDEEEDEEDYV